MTVVMPRPAGQPISCSIETEEQEQREARCMTSGMTIGAVTMPVSSARLRKRPKRIRTKARQRAQRDGDRRAYEGDPQAESRRPPRICVSPHQFAHTSGSKTRPRQ